MSMDGLPRRPFRKKLPTTTVELENTSDEKKNVLWSIYYISRWCTGRLDATAAAYSRCDG